MTISLKLLMRGMSEGILTKVTDWFSSSADMDMVKGESHPY
jgi:hypothetical protein